jgi:hypothetical protein
MKFITIKYIKQCLISKMLSFKILHILNHSLLKNSRSIFKFTVQYTFCSRSDGFVAHISY